MAVELGSANGCNRMPPRFYMSTPPLLSNLEADFLSLDRAPQCAVSCVGEELHIVSASEGRPPI